MSDSNPELPPNAGRMTEMGFEPDDEWLMTAESELRHRAMEEWFTSRFEDPADSTPYISKEGGYIYIFGGPHDAKDELTFRFSHVCSEEAIQAVIDAVESGGTTEWAPLHSADYDAQFEYRADVRSDAYDSFLQRLEEANGLATLQVDLKSEEKLRQLLFGALIGALEAYLADTMMYCIEEDELVFRRFVSECKEFQRRKFPLSEILSRMHGLRDEVRDHLQDLNWHRLDKVIPLMKSSLNIAIPPFGTLMKHITIRHDIVHRAGKTKEGQRVDISKLVLNQLRTDVLAFVDDIELELSKHYPTL